MTKLLKAFLLATFVLLVTNTIAASPTPYIKRDRTLKHNVLRVPFSEYAFPTGSGIPKGQTVEAPITEAPSGQTTDFNVSGISYQKTYEYSIFGESDFAASMIEGDDGYYYLYNVFGGFKTDSYLKCKKEGSQLVATLPQPIFQIEDWDDPSISYTYYACMLKTVGIDEFVLDSDVKEVRFNIMGDGSLRLDIEYDDTIFDEDGWHVSPDMIFGIVDSEGEWSLAGDCKQTWVPFTDKPVTVPEDLITEEWAMIADGFAKYVNIGFHEDKVYIKGINETHFPEAWIMGTRKGNTIEFPSGQYLGLSNQLGMYFYFYASTVSTEDWTLSDSIVFQIDDRQKIMYVAGSANSMTINASKTEIKYLENYYTPVFASHKNNASPIPANPMITSSKDDFNYTQRLSLILPNFSTDGDILDTENMYYQIRKNGNVFLFDHNDYMMLNEDMINVPYAYNDGFEFVANKTRHIVFLYGSDFETIGVQLFNRIDGVDYASDIVTLNLETGEITASIKEVELSGQIKAIEYYSLNGGKVVYPHNGVFIKKTIYDNDHYSFEKVFVK